MANSFTIAQGEILRMNIRPVVDGEFVTIGNDWNVGVFIIRDGSSTKIDLAPTIVDGVAVIEYDTVSLCPGRFIGDIRITETGNDDTFSDKFLMYLNDTITEPTTR